MADRLEPKPSPPGNSQGSSGPSRFPWKTAVVLLILGLLLVAWQLAVAVPRLPSLSYTAFHSLVQEGKVEWVLISGSDVQGALTQKQPLEGREVKEFETVLPPEAARELVPLLTEKGVTVRAESDRRSTLVQLAWLLLPWVLVVGAWAWLSRRATRNFMGASGPFGGMLRTRSHRVQVEQGVAVRFDDVAGLGAAKSDLREVVDFLREPDRFRRLGGKIPRGILLVGPPGTGKTLLARAVAGEAGVPFFSMNGSEFIELFVGMGAARVRELFEEARQVAPSIVFIDEIDAVGRTRGAGLGGGHDEREQTLNQMLSEMDGFQRNDQTIVLAGTNRPDVLDPALLRPGRFDRRVLIDRPESAARQSILEVHTRDKPLGSSVSLHEIAMVTPGLSGADLANLVNEAALQAVRRRGDRIEAEDFAAAMDKVMLGDARETVLSPDEKRRIALHESGHTLVGWLCPGIDPPRRVSILPRGMSLGHTQQVPSADRHIHAQPEFEGRLRMLLGGYAAESLVLGNVSSGSEDDLRKASDLAFQMVAHFGMSRELGPVYYEHRAEHAFLGQRLGTESGVSDRTVHLIEVQARELLVAASEAAERLLAMHRDTLDHLVAALLERETLERDDLELILRNTERARVREHSDAAAE